MITANSELLDTLAENGYTTLQIKCAVIGRATSSRISYASVNDILVNSPSHRHPDGEIVFSFDRVAVLKENWNNDEWLKFLTILNFNYDSGHGRQEVFGVVWLTDGAWLERCKYDGAEEWELKKLPTIPAELEA